MKTLHTITKAKEARTMLKVLKFGGSSMADAHQLEKVRSIVEADPARRVVVVSAAGKRFKDDHKITDLLYLCHAHLQYGVSCDGIFDMVRSRYLEIRDELGLSTPLEAEFDALRAKMDKGVSAETLERYDERPYSPLFCRSVRGISSAPEDCVAQMQFELLRQHANAGESFVVLGRCAEEVLADREGLISIFVRADLDFRVKRTPLPEEEALDFIKHQDRQRRIYHDQHCKGDWGDAKCYDLVINSARLDIPGTVDILEQYIRSRAAQFDDRPAGE